MVPGGRGVRLIATDLDGTLLRRDLSISARARQAIADATAAGIAVVAATGRGWRSAAPLLGDVPHVEHAVCSNGSEIHHIHRSRTTDIYPIARETQQRIREVIAESLPELGVGWARADGVFRYDRAFWELHQHSGLREPDPAVELPAADDMLKLLVHHPTLDERELIETLVAVLPDGVRTTFSGVGTVEITGEGVHKAAALEVLCERLGIIADEVVAMGDNGNDLEMLRWAGCGVAMGNAVPEAVEAADEQTEHHMDDGAAIVIERALASSR